MVELHAGDCLDVCERLANEGARFSLVYGDPPYNAGGTRGARLGKGERAHGEPAYADTWGGLEGFLTMLEPRLAAIRDVLAVDGSFWLHLDHRAVHDAKVLADRVFGRGSFRGEVIWVPGNGGRKRSGLSVTHQTILVYAKSSSYYFAVDDPELREPYAETSLSMHFQAQDDSGRAYRERTVHGKTYRYYADRGRRRGSVWTDIPAMAANTPLRAETTGYPTQKPLRLLERIVVAASPVGGSVLDPMCGSGTTLVAAARLGRRAVGIDRSPVALRVTTERLTNGGVPFIRRGGDEPRS